MADLDVHAERGAPDDVSVEGLDELRSRIDGLDETIVGALATRFGFSRDAAPHKAGSIHDPEREAAVVEHVEAVAGRLGLDPAIAAAVYRVILELSLQDQLETSSGKPG